MSQVTLINYSAHKTIVDKMSDEIIRLQRRMDVYREKQKRKKDEKIETISSIGAMVTIIAIMVAAFSEPVMGVAKDFINRIINHPKNEQEAPAQPGDEQKNKRTPTNPKENELDVQHIAFGIPSHQENIFKLGPIRQIKPEYVYHFNTGKLTKLRA